MTHPNSAIPSRAGVPSKTLVESYDARTSNDDESTAELRNWRRLAIGVLVVVAVLEAVLWPAADRPSHWLGDLVCAAGMVGVPLMTLWAGGWLLYDGSHGFPTDKKLAADLVAGAGLTLLITAASGEWLTAVPLLIGPLSFFVLLWQMRRVWWEAAR